MTTGLPDYQVFVMSRNRPELLAATLRSILAAGCPPERITVSDNSTDESVRALLPSFPGVRAIFRRPPLPLLEHSNTLIRTATAGYFFMLHDDDLVQPDFFTASLALIERHPTVAAATLNARYFEGETLHELCCPTVFRERVVSGGANYLRTYFALNRTFFAFPGHVYRTARVAASGALLEGADKYSDIVFLASLAAHSGIAQNTEVGLLYRRHPHQGSANITPHLLTQIIHLGRRRGMDISGERETLLFRLSVARWRLRFRAWPRARRRLMSRFMLLLLCTPSDYGWGVRTMWRLLAQRLRRR